MSGNKGPRIVFMNHWAGKLGGAEHSLLDILSVCAKQAECSLITSEEGPLTARARALGCAVHVIPCSPGLAQVRRHNTVRALLGSWKVLWSYLRFVRHASAVIKSTGPGLVHANVPKSHATLLLAARLGYRGACVFHLREIFDPGSPPRIFYRALFPRKTGHIIAISSAVKETLPGVLKRRAGVIYNGVQVPHAIPPRPAPGNTLRLLYLGRIVPWKGCHLLVEVMRELIQRDALPGVELSMIGDTLYWPQNYREELLRRIGELDLAQRCRVLPHTDTPSEAYFSHDIFCIASRNEPFGRVVAEALAHGLPVIAFRSGGIPEIVEDGRSGMLVPCGDTDAFARAVETLASDTSRIRAMGMYGRERVRRDFNRETQAPAIVKQLLEWSTGPSNRPLVQGL
jgi:glycosyltransferase involved in cell wall biosynthesis